MGNDQRIEDLERQVLALTAALTAQGPNRTRRSSRVGRLSIGSIVGLFLALLLGAVALAAIPGAGGVITGCYDTKSGALRVIDAQAGKACSKSETQLTWNQVGPQGPKGDTGVQGPKGDTGAQGPAGPKGINWRGGYTLETTYQPGDAVQLNGNAYIATATTSEAPGPTVELGTPWDLLAMRGLQGPQGAPGISGYEVVSAASPFDSNASKGAAVSCPAGKRLLGGGAEIFPSVADPNRDTAPVVLASSTSNNNDGWIAHAVEIGTYTFSWDLTATAICANVAP